MYLVIIAWVYVALMMALAEATSPQGGLLGAVVTFVLYGVLPIGLLVYLMATPLRSKARAKKEMQAHSVVQPPDASGHPATAAEEGMVPPVRKEP